MLRNKPSLKAIQTGAFLIIAVSLLIFSLKYKSPEKDSDAIYQKAYNTHYKIFAPQIPAKITFAGETVPTDLYYVREAIDRELLTNAFWQSNLMLFFKRAYRYFPIIEPILKEEKVPDDFKYLALIESSLTNISSPAGASGFWQFMKAAGTRHGLEISPEVDERYNLEKATHAACSYLKASCKNFDSWTCAAAAYNMGDSGLRNQLKKQKQTCYWELLLNQETSRYVSRIIAAKLILENPIGYGIHIRQKDLYQPIPTREIAVDSSIADLVDFALEQKTTYRILKEFNPWLRSNSLPNKMRKRYILLLPKEGYLSYQKQISSIENHFALYKDSLTIDNIH